MATLHQPSQQHTTHPNCCHTTPPSHQDEGSEDAELDDAAWAKAVTAGKTSKGDKLGAVDHATIEYPPFRRNFYIEVGD
jgi:hypothetical protein